MVVTISPNFSLYRIVVLPAASKPTMRIRICFFPKIREKSADTVRPMAGPGGGGAGTDAGCGLELAGRWGMGAAAGGGGAAAASARPGLEKYKEYRYYKTKQTPVMRHYVHHAKATV